MLQLSNSGDVNMEQKQSVPHIARQGEKIHVLLRTK